MSETGTAGRPTRRVRPWIAALLSLLAPGLGHFYARRTRRAFVWIGVWVVVYAGVHVSLLLLEERGWLLGLPALLIAALAHLVDAFLSANAHRSVEPSSPVRLLGYVAVYAVGLGLQLTAGQLLPIRSFYIPSESMLPTLEVGDRIFVRMYSPLCPAPSLSRGDIVLIRVRSEFEVRRVVGVQGDRVRLDGGGLVINGERATGPVQGTIERVSVRGDRIANDWAEERLGAAEPWVVYARAPLGWGPDYDGEVPEGHVFTLGDNRANSNDDRMNRPTAVEAVAGRALRVPFSLAHESFAFPWRDLRVRPGASCASS
jgi:signal peptidase I